MTTATRPIILCGGSGTRLWPVSRETLPKQFAPLLGKQSPFQATVLRTQTGGLGRPLIVTSHAHRMFVESQLDELGIDADIVLEPLRRDSGPAVAAGCLTLLKESRGSIALVLASDHIVSDPTAFHRAVHEGREAAMAGYLVTFGVNPTRPEVGYGYIERGATLCGEAARVTRFAEKPSAVLAEQYVAAGMLWNSGNFEFSVDALIEEYRKFDPATIDAVEKAYLDRTENGRVIMLGAAYGNAAARSIDYAVMEKTSRAAVVPMSCGWSDIGTWDSIWACGSPDDAGNVINGDVELLDSQDCFVSTSGALTSLVGLKEIVVVAEGDAILVADRRRCGDVKQLVSQLRAKGRAQAESHSKVYRPWGWYEVTDQGEQFQVKRLFVHPGGKLSLQKHRFRAEHWVVVQGQAVVTVDDDVRTLTQNQHAYIPLGAVHRLENRGRSSLEIVEVQSGSYLGEDDIVRLEDVYDRACTPANVSIAEDRIRADELV